MAANTAHHLLIDEPADLLGRARRARLDGGPHAELAGAVEACVKTPGGLPPATLRRPALWIGFEARRPQIEAVETLMAEVPGLDAELIRHDGGGDVGERRAYGGGGCAAEGFGHRGAHFVAHGEDDANLAGEGEG